MTLSDLIIQYRKEHDLSQRQLASICNLSNGYISMLEKGINPNTNKPMVPTLPKLNLLAEGMGMTLSELFEAVDDMPVDLSLQPSQDLPSNVIPMPEMRRIPLVGSIACGAPILAEEHIEDFLQIPKEIKADFALQCKGDSMINARIWDGDIVYIRQQETVENGEIAAVLVDGGEATLKRVRLFKDHIVLEPANPMYPPKPYWNEEMNQVRILGKAVAFTSAVR